MPIVMSGTSAAAHQERQDRHAARCPPRPHVRQNREEAEEHAPRLPETHETGDRGLARRERITLDFHVEEVLDRDAQDRRPEEAGADGGRHEGPDDVLTRPDAEAGEDHARPEHLAERQRLGHVAVRHRRQVAVAEGVEKFWGIGSGITCSLITHGAILVHLLPFVPTTRNLRGKHTWLSRVCEELWTPELL